MAVSLTCYTKFNDTKTLTIKTFKSGC